MDISKIEKINTFLRNKGYDLRKIKGYSDDNVISKALSKEDALNALDLYCYLEIPILGGDVFYLNQNKDIYWTHDNWYINQLENENDTQFLKRSIEESRNYINSYNNIFLKNSHFLFDIIYKKN